MKKINLMLIANDPALAAYALQCGVDRIFVDLEFLGKQARQGHLDTVISRHSIDDVTKVRAAVNPGALLVRTNPMHVGSHDEIETILCAKPDYLMLPMFRTKEEVNKFIAQVRGRARVVLLFETPESVENFSSILDQPGIDEIYFGLNDLQIAYGLKHMFAPLANGSLENWTQIAHQRGIKFGFGGLSRIGSGSLPAEYILGEHVRLGSECVILSRSFHGNSKNYSELIQNIDLKQEIQKIRKAETDFQKRSLAEGLKDHNRMKSILREQMSVIPNG